MNRLRFAGAARAACVALLGTLLGLLTGCPGPVECIRAINCVQTCGGPVMQSGCAACPAGTFDDIVCRGDAGDAGDVVTSDASDGSPSDAADATPTDAPPADAPPADAPPADAGDSGGPVTCGTMTCGATQICVMPCSGIDSGMPLVPRCVDPPASCGSTPTCGCLTGSVCPPASPPLPGCREDGPRHFTCSGCA